VTDTEIVTLAVAHEMMGVDHAAAVPALAGRRLGHLFAKPRQQPGGWKRRQRCSDTIERLISVLAADSPGYPDQVVPLDFTPVGSVEPARRFQLADTGHTSPRSANPSNDLLDTQTPPRPRTPQHQNPSRPFADLSH
jgi:hypothetical protein